MSVAVTLAPIPAEALASACRHTEEHARELATFLESDTAAEPDPRHRWLFRAVPIAAGARWFAVATFDHDGYFLGVL